MHIVGFWLLSTGALLIAANADTPTKAPTKMTESGFGENRSASSSEKSRQVDGGRTETTSTRAFCSAVRENIAAQEAARSKAELNKLAATVDARLDELEQKTKMLKEWAAKRDEFSSRAQDSLVQIYSKMQAESAAPRLSAMPEQTAAAIFLRLDPKHASAIMSEIETVKAAQLSSLIAAAAELGGGRTQANGCRPPSSAGAQ